MSHAMIYEAVRTPRGKGKKDGSLHQASPVWLLSTLLRALQRREHVVALDVAQVVGGEEVGAGGREFVEDQPTARDLGKHRKEARAR